MDIKRLRELSGTRQLKESPVPDRKAVEQRIADEVYKIAEAAAADDAYQEGGHGFHGDAIHAHAEKILQAVLARISYRISHG